MECEEGVLVWKTPMTLAGLGIDLKELAESRSVKITCFNTCMGNPETRYINKGDFTIIDCYDGSFTKWEVHYLGYINEYSIDVKVCQYQGAPPPTPCHERKTQSECESAGCYWFDDSCHSYPDQQGDDDLTDYDRIQSDLSDVINPIGVQVSAVDGLVRGVSGLISSVAGSLTSQLEGVLTGVTGLIGSLDTKVSGLVEGLTVSLTGGFTGITEQIAGLQFPTIDLIKDAFLDVCADLAAALWDAILDKIEERYPDDDKE